MDLHRMHRHMRPLATLFVDLSGRAYLKNGMSTTHDHTSLTKSLASLCGNQCLSYDQFFQHEIASFRFDKLSNLSKFQLINYLNVGRSTDLPLRGVLVLLMSKTAMHKKSSSINKMVDVTPSQANLAKIVEMMHISSTIHSDIDRAFRPPQTMEKKRLSLLVGDYIWATSAKLLADLHNVDVFRVMTNANTNLSQAMFMSEMEAEPRASNASINLDYWKEKNFLRTATLTASGCKAALMLARLGEDLQAQAYDFGLNFGYCLQGWQEIEWFKDATSSGQGKIVDLYSLPVVMLDSELDEVNTILTHSQHQSDRLRSIVIGSNALDKSREVIESLRNTALVKLNAFEDCQSKRCLEQLIRAFQL